MEFAQHVKNPSYGSEAANAPKFGAFEASAGVPEVTVWFNPSEGEDAIVDELQKIDCSQGGSLFIEHARLFPSRSDVITRLETLALGGCEVHVHTRDMRWWSDSEDRCVGSDYITLQSARDDSTRQGYLSTYSSPGGTIHSKYMIFDGVFDGRRTQLAWIGSHNITVTALEFADENLVRIEDAAVYEALRTEWEYGRRVAEDSCSLTDVGFCHHASTKCRCAECSADWECAVGLTCRNRPFGPSICQLPDVGVNEECG